MKNKSICIGIISMFFLTSIITISAMGSNVIIKSKDNTINTLSDSWIRISKPLDEEKIVYPGSIVMEAETSEDIDVVTYIYVVSSTNNELSPYNMVQDEPWQYIWQPNLK